MRVKEGGQHPPSFEVGYAILRIEYLILARFCERSHQGVALALGFRFRVPKRSGYYLLPVALRVVIGGEHVHPFGPEEELTAETVLELLFGQFLHALG